MPSAVVIAVRTTPVSTLVAVTVAPGTTAWVASMIVPRIPPRSVCAQTEVREKKLTSTAAVNVHSADHSRLLIGCAPRAAAD